MVERRRKARAVAATAAATIALAVPVAVARAQSAAEAPVQGTSLTEQPPKAALQEPTPDHPAPGPIKEGEEIVPPATDTPSSPAASGGVSAGDGKGQPAPAEGAEDEAGAGEASEGAAAPNPSSVLQIPALPSSACAATGVPPVLIPIYQRAAAQYELGPQGPAVLAGINAVETGFGTNLGPSSAGAVGWMQFMPSTWAMYGVDANRDGLKDPDNPEDAIFAAAGYLSAAGMPRDTYAAIYAYNHADWYVSEVLANAGCYAHEVGGPAFTAAGLGPQIEVLRCEPAPDWKQDIPDDYLKAFEGAAARYELGKRGVWALAAIAHLESDFGRGMNAEQLETEGPLGLDPTEWSQYRVDGDGDGHIRPRDVADSAATLARLIWSRGSLSAGIFTHNQAEWFVQEVLQEAEAMEGGCKVSYIDWRIAPLSSGAQVPGSAAVLNPNGIASAPAEAPPAVKAAIEAANSISTTPYVWGGGHGSWYSYGYDCSGAVSFALYGAGLLDTPLTSGELESYGEPGPGRWITIYASPTHTYAVIAGLRWDTVGDAHGTGPRWHVEPPYPEGFVVRHPIGY
ncbi:MAG TPA: lytic murein transglycosylase [Solirubrobacterales bacterium]|jgi:cell wall-associated NlpC family hydrolase/soluble lytic murein transglycosylase-like protein|nr:lytic murein transglycosylase [Solirubrobacterales bacterium]